MKSRSLFAAAIVVGRNAWAWRCMFLTDSLFEEQSFDFNRACQTQHDDPRAYGSPRDGEDPYSWECFVGG